MGNTIENEKMFTGGHPVCTGCCTLAERCCQMDSVCSHYFLSISEILHLRERFENNPICDLLLNSKLVERYFRELSGTGEGPAPANVLQTVFYRPSPRTCIVAD